MPILGGLLNMSRTTDRGGGRGQTLRVVVVDDSPIMRGLIADLLDDAGVAVVGEASDGTEALEIVAETRPDVVTIRSAEQDPAAPLLGFHAELDSRMLPAGTRMLQIELLTHHGERQQFPPRRVHVQHGR